MEDATKGNATKGNAISGNAKPARCQQDPVLHIPHAHDGSVTVGREVPRAIVLEQIGKASLKIFGAAYCMVAYIEHGEKHFIALGLEDGAESEISHLLKQHLHNQNPMLVLLYIYICILLHQCILQHFQFR